MNGDEYLVFSAASVVALGIAITAYRYGQIEIAIAALASFGIWLVYTMFAAALTLPVIARQAAEDIGDLGASARDVWGVLR